MIVGGIRLITYESAVTLNSGPHGVSVTAAPPVVVAGLEHDRPQPGPGEVGGGDEPVVAAADDDRVVLLGCLMCGPLVARTVTSDSGQSAMRYSN